jgi:hypothetical protein
LGRPEVVEEVEEEEEGQQQQQQQQQQLSDALSHLIVATAADADFRAAALRAVDALGGEATPPLLRDERLAVPALSTQFAQADRAPTAAFSLCRCVTVPTGAVLFAPEAAILSNCELILAAWAYFAALAVEGILPDRASRALKARFVEEGVIVVELARRILGRFVTAECWCVSASTTWDARTLANDCLEVAQRAGHAAEPPTLTVSTLIAHTAIAEAQLELWVFLHLLSPIATWLAQPLWLFRCGHGVAHDLSGRL